MPDSVDMKFCDLCGHSIPIKDLEDGIAKRVGERLVGACCLPSLVSVPDAASTSAGSRGKDSSSSGTLLTAAVLLFGAIFASAWFLDWKGEQRRVDLGKAQDALGGRIAAIESGFATQKNELETLLRENQTALRSELESRAEKLDGRLVELEKSRPKGAPELTGLTTRLARVGQILEDLAARQRTGEKLLTDSTRKLENGLEEMAGELVELRRRLSTLGSTVPSAASSSKTDRPALETASSKLPASLGRKIDQLSSGDEGVRWAAVDELIRSGDKRVQAFLIPVLKDPDQYVRKLCAEGLGKIGDSKSYLPLVNALGDKSAIVRMAAYRSLVQLTKQNFPFDPDENSEAKRKRAIQKWRSWAERQKG